MSLFEYIFNHKLRVISLFLINIIALIVGSFLMPGIDIPSFGTAAVVILAISLVNILIRPLLLKVMNHLPLIIFGIVGLFLDAIILYITAFIFDAFVLNNLFEAFVLSLIISLVNTFATSLFHIDETDSYYQNVIRKIDKKTSSRIKKNGLVIMQIDGLSAPLVKEEIAKGKLPTLEKFIKDNTHNLVEWESDLPSMTSASQAGIMYGHHENIPAFRWWDKSTSRLLVSNHPKDAVFIDEFLSKGRVGLLKGGSSINNLFTGGAEHSVMTMSQIVDSEGQRQIKNEDFNDYLRNPYNVSRSLVLMALEILVEYKEAIVQRLNKVTPRMHRGGYYPFLRAAVCVLLRDVTTFLVVSDIYRGKKIIYADYLGYDEVSHHSGVKTADAKRVLEKLDKTVAVLYKAIQTSGHQMDLVLVSDHGQSWGDTFKQKYKKSLQELIGELTDIDNISKVEGSDESKAQVNAMFSEASNQKGVVGKTSKKLSKEKDNDKNKDLEKQEAIVCASGNLAQVYFTRSKDHLTKDELDKVFPKLIPSLISHPGIGFIMVATKDGPEVLGVEGSIKLKTKKITGKNPLDNFSPNTAKALLSLSKYTNLGDIVINSSVTPDGEVHAFEELIGSHGGAGGWQTRPFLMYPASWGEDPKIFGAGEVYEFLTKHYSSQ